MFSNYRTPGNRWLPVGLLLVFFATPLLAQAPPAQQPPARDPFAAKDYPAYLATLPQELTPNRSGVVPLENLTRVAIALEKTGSWKGLAGIHAHALLKDNPEATHALDALQVLVEENPEGLRPLMAGKLATSMALGRASRILREHGFEFASNALGALFPDMPGRQIVCLVSIPLNKRPAVEEVFMAYIHGPMNQSMLAHSALELFLRPPLPSDIVGLSAFDPHDCYVEALKLGKGTNLISFDTATQIMQAGKKVEAVQMVTGLASEKPADETVQNHAAWFLWRSGDMEGATAIYQRGLMRVPEPDRRAIRIGYLDFLQWQKKTEEITRLQADRDPLLAGDACLMTGQFENAAARFGAVLADGTAPVEQKLAAWAGMVDADPARALAMAPAVLKGLQDTVMTSLKGAPAANLKLDLASPPTSNQKSDSADPGRLVAWTGRQLWTAVNRDIPPPPGLYPGRGAQQSRSLLAVPGWGKQASGIATALLEIDATACLRPDPRFTPTSFRRPSAVIFAMAGQSEKAVEILGRVVEWQVDPPPGGWTIFDGAPGPNPNKPRSFSSPDRWEAMQVQRDVLEDLSRTRDAATIVPPLAVVLAEGLSRKLAGDKDQDIRVDMESLAAVAKCTVSSLDSAPTVLRTNSPAPPPRKVDLAAFAGIDQAVRQAMANDQAARQGLLLVNSALRPALLSATNPDFLMELTDLSIFTIERHAQAIGMPQSALSERKLLADYLRGRKVVDMKPCIDKLIAQ